VIHTGKLIHFAPENGIYVYFRYNDIRKVMIVLNKNSTSQELQPDRFAEMLKDVTYGADVLTGKTFELENSLSIPALSPLIIELN